jgi:hypothetical protein
VPAFDDLRVTRDHFDIGGPRRGGDCGDLGFEILGRKTLLEDDGKRQRERLRAAHRQVVHRPVDRQVADRPTGEANRLDHEAVCRDRKPVHDCGVRVFAETEGRAEEPLDERKGRLTAGAVCHRDLRVAEPERLRLDPLDQPQNVLLGARLGRHQTTARSRAKRP